MLRIARKREKTETVGTEFGTVAAVEEAVTAAVVTAGDGLMEAEVVRSEELLSGVLAGRGDESCVRPAAEARLVSGCGLRDVAGAGVGEEESAAAAGSPFALENPAGAVCT